LSVGTSRGQEIVPNFTSEDEVVGRSDQIVLATTNNNIAIASMPPANAKDIDDMECLLVLANGGGPPADYGLSLVRNRRQDSIGNNGTQEEA
jgi:hypothetical protein